MSTSASAHRPVSRNMVTPIPKRQIPPRVYQQSGDDIEALEGSSAMARYVLYVMICL